MWAEDVDDDADQVEVDFLEYRNNGYWDFPITKKKLNVQVKFIIAGPVTPSETSTKGYKFKEDEETKVLYNRVKKLYKSSHMYL